MDKIPKPSKFLCDDSPQNSPKPQASSTLMTSKTLSDPLDIRANLSYKMDPLNSASSTTSSLGVIDIDKQSLFSDKDSSLTKSLHESILEKTKALDEQMSISISNFKKRLQEITKEPSCEDNEFDFKVPFSTENTDRLSSSKLFNFTDLSANSTFHKSFIDTLMKDSTYTVDEKFESANSASKRVEDNHKENVKKFASIPTSPVSISETSNYNYTEDGKSISEYLRARSYLPDEVANVLRNLKHDTQPPLKELTNFGETFVKEKLISKIPVPINEPKNLRAEHQIQSDLENRRSTASSLEETTSSSIASISQIAEILRRKSLIEEPKLAIEHLLAIGKSRQQLEKPEGTFQSTNASDKFELTPKNNSGDSTKTQNTIIKCDITESTMKEIEQKDKKCNVVKSDEYNGSWNSKNVTYVKSSTEMCRFKFTKMRSNFVEYDPKVNDISHLEYIVLNDECNGITSKASDNLKTKYCKRNDSLTTGCFDDPIRKISVNHSIDGSLADENVSVAEIMNVGILCIGTYAEIDLSIENPMDIVLKYKLRLNSITVDKQIDRNAASVLLLSKDNEFVLNPRRETEIKVMISPRVNKRISVVLEFISLEKQFSNVSRMIELTGEIPKLELNALSKAEINFGTLPESCRKSIPFVLKNVCSARFPVKFVVTEGEERVKAFHAKATIESNGSFDCNLTVDTSRIDFDSSGFVDIAGQVSVLLDTPDVSIAPYELLSLPIIARVGRVDLRFSKNELTVYGTTDCAVDTVSVRNTGTVSIEFIAVVDDIGGEFAVQPRLMKLEPSQEQLLKVQFKANSTCKFREASLRLITNQSDKQFVMHIVGVLGRENSNNDHTPCKPAPRKCTTPNSGKSSSGSSTGADGPMELDSTHKVISWGSVPLHAKQIQTITLRNRSYQREKLLITIVDSHNAFTFIENESYEKEIKLTLDSKESRKISICFMPFIADQQMTGKIIITRRHCLESSIGEMQKRVIPLYGIGGHTKIVFSSVFRDNECRIWITPEADTYETKFSIENTGDATAFVKIVSDESDDIVTPEEIILLPAESAEVQYSLNLNKDRLDLLFKQNPFKDVLLVNRLTVHCGAESTRLRLKRLWKEYNSNDQIQKLCSKLENIVHLQSCDRVHVDNLHDIPTAVTTLWYEGVTEQMIGVLIQRQDLESASLDTTVIFNNLLESTAQM